MFNTNGSNVKDIVLQLDIINDNACTRENKIPDSILVAHDGTCILGAGTGDETFYVIYFPSWEMMMHFLPELSVDLYIDVPISVEEINIFHLPPGPLW